MGEPDSEIPSEKLQSLFHMSSLVLSTVQTNRVTSCAKIADEIVNLLSQTNPEAKNNQRTITRRVYDVLNVFAAAGLISKTDTEVRFQPGAGPAKRIEIIEQMRVIKSRIALKEAGLIERAQLHVCFGLLIERNHGRQLPVPAFALPLLFVGFVDIGQGEVIRVLNGSKLEISARSAPKFFSPMEVFERMNFGTENRIRMLRKTPAIAPLESLVFPDAMEIQEDGTGEKKELFQIEIPQRDSRWARKEIPRGSEKVT
jgi:hypothetical protein